LAAVLFALVPAQAARADEDRDKDGLSDFAEVRKYGSDPGKADTDDDGIPDGDWNERREHAYTIRAVLRVLRPVTTALLEDDQQDARVLAETPTYVDVEFVLYPFNTSAHDLDARAGKVSTDPALEPYLRPGITTNWDAPMRKRLLADLSAAGIRPAELTDVETVRQASGWLLGASTCRSNMFCTYYMHYPDGKPAILPGCEEAFAKDRGEPTWSVGEQIAHELLGRSMFEKRTYGTCTSTAVYLATVLRALGIPTRMLVTIPPADASDPAQVRAVAHGIAHPEVRAKVLQGLGTGSAFTAHTIDEVFVGGRWTRLNSTTLGDGILNPRYQGLLVRVNTFDDLSEARLAETWGLRYARGERTRDFPASNPYRALVVDDLVGPHATPPGSHGANPAVAPREHARITVRRAYWADSDGFPAWLSPAEARKRQGKDRLFLIHVDDWFEEQPYTQLKTFMLRADPRWVLRAEGLPDVPARLNLWYFTNADIPGGEFELTVAAADAVNLVSGVAYTLHPLNEGKDRAWAVADGVTLTAR
jgi:hypothetical protein